MVEQKVEPEPSRSSAGRVQLSRSAPCRINHITAKEGQRYLLGIDELDTVLGGGLTPGSSVLLGGEPGIGKSTLLLQAAVRMAAYGKVLYISEEAAEQIKLRYQRIAADNESAVADNIYLLAQTDIDSALAEAAELQPALLILDSVQALFSPQLESAAGSVSQVRAVAAAAIAFAREHHAAVMLIGHVTKEGMLAGPRVLEHMVDTVLYFEGDRHASYRILRAVKNRFGSTNEIGVFEMQNSGLEEVKNPSEFLLNGRPENASGSVVACSMEGTRPILVEIQALVCQSNFGIPRRTAVGTDFNRVNLLMAVLEKKAGVHLAASDAYVNIAGGMKMTEPAIDLGICLAIISSAKEIVIPDSVMAFGEIGLSGEVRAVSMAGQRVQEAKKLGFETVILPEVNRTATESIKGIKLVYVAGIRDAISFIRGL